LGLCVSRTTVCVGYDRLVSEGFVTSRAGAGTFVNGHCESRRGGMRRPPGVLRPRPFWDEVKLPTGFWRPTEFDLRSGTPDARLCIGRVTNEPRSGLVLGYGAIATENIDEGMRRLRSCFGG
jgi:DNA-binding transcriptional MocR family regulator